MAASTLGLVVTQAARGAQVTLTTTGRRLPLFAAWFEVLEVIEAHTALPSALHRLRVTCSNPPTPSRSAPPPTSDRLFSQPVRAAAMI